VPTTRNRFRHDQRFRDPLRRRLGERVGSVCDCPVAVVRDEFARTPAAHRWATGR
jgi:hypothetical protein